MKIAIINLTRRDLSRGYRKYLLNIIPRMAVYPGVKSILCAANTKLNIEKWFKDIPNVIFCNCRLFKPFLYFGDKELIHQLEKFSPDVLFLPFQRYFKFRNIPVVNMIQTMWPLVPIMPNDHVSKMQYIFQQYETLNAIKKADKTIAVSNFVKNTLIEKWRIPEKKISMINFGCDIPTEEEIKTYRKPITIPADWENDFLFTAGLIGPYRGLEDIILSMKQIERTAGMIKGIVIAGGKPPKNKKYLRYLRKIIAQNNLFSKICWTGELNQEEMGWCYQSCRAFIMTSRVEACPNIALEAMSHGCMIISADNPPLPEIFGDTAYFYKSGNSSKLARSIQDLFNISPIKAEILSKHSRNRARQFSWDKTVSKTMIEFEEIIRSKK